MYRAWLSETKTVDGAIQIDYDKHGLPFIVKVPFTSDVLPEQYRDDLIFYGTSDRFSGMKIYATPARYEMLLRADQRHGAAAWSTGGVSYGADQPHFHELDFSNGRARPGDRVVVPNGLTPGMDEASLSETFCGHYFFEPEGYEVAAPPRQRTQTRQASLFER